MLKRCWRSGAAWQRRPVMREKLLHYTFHVKMPVVGPTNTCNKLWHCRVKGGTLAMLHCCGRWVGASLAKVDRLDHSRPYSRTAAAWSPIDLPRA